MWGYLLVLLLGIDAYDRIEKGGSDDFSKIMRGFLCRICKGEETK